MIDLWVFVLIKSFKQDFCVQFGVWYRLNHHIRRIDIELGEKSELNFREINLAIGIV